MCTVALRGVKKVLDLLESQTVMIFLTWRLCVELWSFGGEAGSVLF